MVWGGSESPRSDWGTSSRVRRGARSPAQHLELGSTSLTEVSPGFWKEVAGRVHRAQMGIIGGNRAEPDSQCREGDQL